MHDDEGPTAAPSTPARPPRHEPPSGWKIAGVLTAMLVFCCVACVGVTFAYGYFVEVKSLR